MFFLVIGLLTYGFVWGVLFNHLVNFYNTETEEALTLFRYAFGNIMHNKIIVENIVFISMLVWPISFSWLFYKAHKLDKLEQEQTDSQST